jgi:hypothetical protein
MTLVQNVFYEKKHISCDYQLMFYIFAPTLKDEYQETLYTLSFYRVVFQRNTKVVQTASDQHDIGTWVRTIQIPVS